MMRFLSVHSGQLVELGQWQRPNAATRRVSTGISDLDALFGPAGLTRGAVHELLHQPHTARPLFPALLLARAVTQYAIRNTQSSPTPSCLSASVPPCLPPEQGILLLSDPQREFYPPAAAQLGIPLSRLYLLHPRNREEELWAIAECLASAGVAAVIAPLGKLSQVEARRLQLAAERGEALGLFLRPFGPTSAIYAASTRLLVTPQPSADSRQTWKLQLIHGHGAQLNRSLWLEYDHEEHTLHTSTQLADHQAPAQTPAIHRHNRISA